MLYFLESPINILSVTKFANQLNDDGGTGITTFHRKSKFFWNNKQYSRTIAHPASNSLEMSINDGFSLHALWTHLLSCCFSIGKHHCNCTTSADLFDQELNVKSIQTSQESNDITKLMIQVGETLLTKVIQLTSE